MRATLSLVRREFSSYFLSPIAYVVFFVFLMATGHLFYLTMEQMTARGPHGVNFPLQLMLTDTWFWLVFLFIPPLLTMRLFAEERASGTLEMLMTAPLQDWQVVMSKYLAAQPMIRVLNLLDGDAAAFDAHMAAAIGNHELENADPRAVSMNGV